MAATRKDRTECQVARSSFRLRIVRTARCRRRLEVPARCRGLDQHLLPELKNRESRRDEQQDQDEDEDQETARAHWPGALLRARVPGNTQGRRGAAERTSRRQSSEEEIAASGVLFAWPDGALPA